MYIHISGRHGHGAIWDRMHVDKLIFAYMYITLQAHMRTHIHYLGELQVDIYYLRDIHADMYVYVHADCRYILPVLDVYCLQYI